MKKTLFAIAALAAMTSCSQEMTNIEPQQPKGQTVTINCAMPEDEIAPDSKAAIGKDGFNILWRDYDKISVMVKNGTTWSANTLFERTKGADGKVDPDPTKDNSFTGTFATELAAGANTWYLLHPYSEDIASIGNDTHTPPRVIYKTSTGEYKMVIENATQDYSKENKMGHLNLPMYGIGTGDGATTPTIRMNHFCSVFEVAVTNKIADEISINAITVDTKNINKKITGDFRVKLNPEITENNVTTPESMILLANSTANTFSRLEIKKGKLLSGETGKFYLLAKDFSLKAGETLTITVEARNDTKVKYEYVTVVKTMLKDIHFEPGRIHRTTVDFQNQVNRRFFDNSNTNKLDFTVMKSVPTWMEVTSTATPATSPVLNFNQDKGLIIPPNTEIVIELTTPINYLAATKTNTGGGALEIGAKNKTSLYKDFMISFKNTEKEAPNTKTFEPQSAIDATTIKISTGKKEVSLSEVVIVKPAPTPDPAPAQ